MKISLTLIAFGIIYIFTPDCFAQMSRIYIPVDIQRGFEGQTRSYDGNPGSNFWQNQADYEINVNFDPATAKLSGNEDIIYYNNSPDTLKELVVNLFPDFFKKGNRRDFDISPADESDGVMITHLLLNGNSIDYSKNNSSLSFGHTSFTLRSNDRILPSEKVNLKVSWNYFVNKGSQSRTGAIDSTTYFIAYFFPRIAVYDDINGWNLFDYTGDAEFYNDFGNYNLSVTVPDNYLVWATGQLLNPDEVMTGKYIERYNAAMVSDSIIHIIDSTEVSDNDITVSNNYNTWKFHAENVTDAAFALSDHYLWDAVSITSDKDSGRRVLINSVYNKTSKDFFEVAEISKNVIAYMNDELPGVSFPFPVMTVFNGLDYMEYPMMVNDTTEDINETPELTTHEIFHSYFPFYTGINETNYAWMDEGITSFFTYLIINRLYPEVEDNQPFGNEYRDLIGSFSDEPLFVNSNKLKRPEYDYIFYDKAMSFFLVLQNYLGDKVFLNALREFISRWEGKHPTPYDFFFTFQNVTGSDISWIIKPWFFQYGYVDLAVRGVVRLNNGYKVSIEKKGLLPAHFGLKLYYSDKGTEVLNYNVSVWRQNQNIYDIVLPANRKLVKVEIVDKTLRDAYPDNNIYLTKF
jgi:hypothetical protein